MQTQLPSHAVVAKVSLRASLQMPSDPLVNGSVQGTGTMTEFVMGGFLPITNDGTGPMVIDGCFGGCLGQVVVEFRRRKR